MPPNLDLGLRQAARLRARRGNPRRTGPGFQAAAPVRRQPAGPALVVSGLLHLTALLLALKWNREVQPDRRRVDERTPVRQVEMVYLGPRSRPRPAEPPVPRPDPRPRAETRDTRPPTPVTRTEPTPGAGKSPTTTSSGSDGSLGAGRATTPLAQPSTEVRTAPTRVPASAPDRPGAAEPTLESEAQRLFGPKPPPVDQLSGSGPERESIRLDGNGSLVSNCRPRPHRPRAAGEPPDTGIITGRILRRDTGYPLSGALLQMIGTPYLTYTDDRGWYTFRFDASLVEDCRTQLVRVWAPGYRTQWLSIVVAPQARTSDVLLEPGR